MKTDRELLELAALAAGLEYRHKYGEIVYGNAAMKWNPLDIDGPALRLVVKCNIDLYQGDNDGPAAYAGYFERGSTKQKFAVERHGEDVFAATRRAIVRAAAAIGQSMKEQGK